VFIYEVVVQFKNFH